MILSDTTPAQISHQPINKLFWRYAIPSIGGMIVTGLYYLVDGMIVGQYVGGEGLAAINLAYPLIMLFTGIGAMIAMGGATRISLLQGAGDQKSARKSLANTLLILLGTGVLFPLIILPLMEQVLVVLHADASEALLGYTREYLTWVVAGSALLMGQMIVAALLRNDGRPQLATALLILGAVLNIFLCYLFVAEFGWGMKGAAISTLLAESVVCGCGLGYFFTRYARLRVSLADLRPCFNEMRKLVVLGSPNLVMEFNLALLLYTHNYQLLSYGNDDNVAAFAVAGYTEAMFILLVHGLALGMQPLLSHATGAGMSGRAAVIIRYSISVVLALGITCLVLVFGFSEWIGSMFIRQADQLQELVVYSLRIHLFALPLDGLFIVGVIALQAMAKTRDALMLTIGKTSLLIPSLILLPIWWSVDGVLIAAPLVNIVLGLLATMMLLRMLRELKLDARLNNRHTNPAAQ